MSIVQRMVNSLDEGAGRFLLRSLALLLSVVAVYALYGRSQFRGLREPEAMEYAQLARNLAEGRGFTTDCVRPADLAFLDSRGRGGPGPVPDLRHAPLYPWLLAAGFRLVRPPFGLNASARFHAPELLVILPLGVALCLATGLTLFRLTLRLLDPPSAWAATVILFASEAVLAGGLSGTPLPLAMFLCTAAVHAAVVAVARQADGWPVWRWGPPLVMSALLCSLAALTRYSLAVLAPALALFVGLGFERRKWAVALVFLAVAAAGLSPWLARNQAAAGGWLGLAPYEAVKETEVFEEDAFDQTLTPEMNGASLAPALQRKFMVNLRRILDETLPRMGSGLVLCFFLVSLFCRFERPEAGFLRWCIVLAILLLAPLLALRGGDAGPDLAAFLPMVILFGLAGFVLTAGQLEMARVASGIALLWVFVALSGLAALLRVAGPSASIPYPPCFPPFIAHACGLLGPEEAVATDIPWATAWYGGRRSLLLPRSVAELQAIHAQRFPVGAVYLTTQTGDRPYTSAFAAGPYRSWLPVLNGGIPPDFPFRHGFHMPPGTRDQLFLTDRVRWPEAETAEPPPSSPPQGQE